MRRNYSNLKKEAEFFSEKSLSTINVVTRQETVVILTGSAARTATACTERAENFSWNNLLTEAYKKADCRSIFITFAA